jgi:hypothetical protein
MALFGDEIVHVISMRESSSVGRTANFHPGGVGLHPGLAWRPTDLSRLDAR